MTAIQIEAAAILVQFKDALTIGPLERYQAAEDAYRAAHGIRLRQREAGQ
jgi:hypothetical protein